MSRVQSTAIILIVIIASITLIVPVSGASVDEYPEDCDEAPVINAGSYDGKINSPGDVDAFVFDLEQGNYYSFKFDVSSNEENFWLWFESGTTSPEESVQDVRNADYTVEDYPGVGKFINNVDGGIPFYFEFWGEESSETRYCISVEERPDGGEPPYDWSMEVVKNGDISTPTPTPTATPTPTPTATPTPIPTDTATDSSGDSMPSPTDDDSDSGNDIQDSDGDGVIDSEDYAPNDPEVQEKNDLQDTSSGSGPGFGIGIAVVALLVGTLISLRRS